MVQVLTLTHAVANANDIALYINNVRQEPTQTLMLKWHSSNTNWYCIYQMIFMLYI